MTVAQKRTQSPSSYRTLCSPLPIPVHMFSLGPAVQTESSSPIVGASSTEGQQQCGSASSLCVAEKADATTRSNKGFLSSPHTAMYKAMAIVIVQLSQLQTFKCLCTECVYTPKKYQLKVLAVADNCFGYSAGGCSNG